MIRVQLINPNGNETSNWQEGGKELIERWRHARDAFIWVDLEGEREEDERNFLLDMHCHPLAIEDLQRFRHPPKTENFHSYTMMRDWTRRAMPGDRRAHDIDEFYKRTLRYGGTKLPVTAFGFRESRRIRIAGSAA